MPSLLDHPEIRFVTSGRIAIGLALRALGVGAGARVLVPAYHSPSMIPPVHWCGAEVVFYRIHPDTTPDLDDVAAKLALGASAVMATHFFGIPQDLRPLRALCDAVGAGLIEDCAHCFFGERDGVPVGSTGDYAIGSSMKFFPIYEGGCLVSSTRPLDQALRSAGAGFEAKAALNAMEAAFDYGRLPGLRMLMALPLRLKDHVWRMLKTRSSPSDNAPRPSTLAPSSSDSSFHFDAEWIDKRSSWFSRTVMARASRSRIVDLRRRHYEELQRSLADLPGCRPLFANLPAGACPWVFPVLAADPQAVSTVLQAAGVPMVRFGASLWAGVDESVCGNSMRLGRHLIAFPCHQELTDAERAWMATTIRQAFATCARIPA